MDVALLYDVRCARVDESPYHQQQSLAGTENRNISLPPKLRNAGTEQLLHTPEPYTMYQVQPGSQRNRWKPRRGAYNSRSRCHRCCISRLVFTTAASRWFTHPGASLDRKVINNQAPGDVHTSAVLGINKAAPLAGSAREVPTVDADIAALACNYLPHGRTSSVQV